MVAIREIQEHDGDETDSDQWSEWSNESDDGPTALNPWGRDGLLLDGILHGQKYDSGCNDSEADKLEVFASCCKVRKKEKNCWYDVFAMTDEDGFNAVHHCALGGHAAILGYIMHKVAGGGDINGMDNLLLARCESGETPLHLAVQFKRENIVAMLLRAKANVEEHDSYGQTALDYCTKPHKCKGDYADGTNWPIAGDGSCMQRMEDLITYAEEAQTFERQHLISGLISAQGKSMNGKVCEVMGYDEEAGRCVVRFEKHHLPTQYKRIKVDNLTHIQNVPNQKPNPWLEIFGEGEDEIFTENEGVIRIYPQAFQIEKYKIKVNA